jgi:N-acetylmuramoyl-L-alanine amidase
MVLALMILLMIRSWCGGRAALKILGVLLFSFFSFAWAAEGSRWDSEGAARAFQLARQKRSEIDQATQPALGQYLECAKTYRTVYVKDPHYGRAGDAIYEEGVLFQEMGDRFSDLEYYRTAVKRFHMLVSEYGGNQNCPDALLRSGAINSKHLKDESAAQEAFQLLRTQYGRTGSPKAPDAKTEPPSMPASSPPEVPVKTGATSSVHNIRYWSEPDHTRIMIDMDSDARYEIIKLPPDRVYFDISGAILGNDLKSRTFSVGDQFVKQIRLAQNTPKVVRVVLDCTSAGNYSVTELHNPFRIVIELKGQPAAQQAASPSVSKPKPPANEIQEPLKNSGTPPQGAVPALAQAQHARVPAFEQASPQKSAAAQPGGKEVDSKAGPQTTTIPKSAAIPKPQQPSLVSAKIPEVKAEAAATKVPVSSGKKVDSTDPGNPAKSTKNSDRVEASNKAGESLPRPVSPPVTAIDPKTQTSGGAGLEKARNGSTTPPAKGTESQPSARNIEPPAQTGEKLQSSPDLSSQRQSPQTSVQPGNESPLPAKVDSAVSQGKTVADPMLTADVKPLPIRRAPLAVTDIESSPVISSKAVPETSTAKIPAANAIDKRTDSGNKPPPAIAPAPQPLPKAAQPTSNGDRTLTRMLGLKIGRIVLDPGHGGQDMGTIGPGGLPEKKLVLSIALSLQKLLQDKLGAEVILTRIDDTFLPLEDRIALANQHRADLFVSIHANSSSIRSISGVETYYLNFARTDAEREVAARENATTVNKVRDLEDLVKLIAQADKSAESRELASILQKRLYAGARKLIPSTQNRGVRSAPFIVLIGAHMPSVLAEVAFISNPKDEKLLGKAINQEHLVKALFSGIEDYMKTLGSDMVYTQPKSNK